MAATASLYGPGDEVLVNYGDDDGGLWHTRMVLDHVHSNDYVVASPDYDIFTEELSLQNPDLEGLRLRPPGGGMPPGLARAPVYGFGPITAPDRIHLLQEGARIAAAERAALGILPAGGAAPVALPAAAGAAALIPIAGPAAAAAAPAAAVAPIVAAPAARPAPAHVVPVGGAWFIDELVDYLAERRQFLSDDFRTLAVPNVRVEGDFRDLANMMDVDPNFTVPLSGPHSAPYMVDMQLQEDVIADNPHSPSFESARHYMGNDERTGGARLPPSLRAHIGTELEKEAKIAKELRKAREVGGGYTANSGGGRGNSGGRGGRGRGGRGNGVDTAAAGTTAPTGP